MKIGRTRARDVKGESGVMQGNDARFGRHLEDHEAAAYATGAVSAESRSALESHFAVCAECRGEVTQVRRFLRAQQRKQSLWKLGAAIGAAAAVMLLVVRGPGGGPTPGREPGERGLPAAGSVRGVEAIAPISELRSDTEAIAFVWRPVGRDAHYQVTLASEAGAQIWTAGTADTAIRLPPSVRLERGRVYLWYVDAVLADGSSAKSELRELRIVP